MLKTEKDVGEKVNRIHPTDYAWFGGMEIHGM